MPFDFKATGLPGLVIVKPTVFSDKRGAFFETYKRSDFIAAGIIDEFAQDNQSISKNSTLRGLHFQRSRHAQSKLVWVVRGTVWDVSVDLRKGSPSYIKWFGLELSSENGSRRYSTSRSSNPGRT